MRHRLKLALERSLKRLRLYKRSPYQVYHLSRHDDFFVHIEHPKCGRTWLRYMIGQAQASKHGIPLANSLHDVCYPELSLPRVYWVHGLDPLRPFAEYSYRAFLNEVRRPKGVIFQVRQPERVMVSYYHQCRFRDFREARGAPTDLKRFIRDPNFGIAKFVEFVDHYLPLVERVEHLLIKYEDLKADTAGTLATTLDFVSLSLPEPEIRRIVANSTAAKMRELEERQKYGLDWVSPRIRGEHSSYKVRTLKAEALETVFDTEDLVYMRSVYARSKCLARLGYR